MLHRFACLAALLLAAAIAPSVARSSASTASAVNLLANFDRGAGSPAAWAFRPGAEFPGAKGALKSGTPTGRGLLLRYDLGCGAQRISGMHRAGCGRYVAAARRLPKPLPLPSPQAVLSFDLRHPSASAEVGVRATDATGQTLQYGVWSRTLENPDGQAWQRVQVRLDRPALSWGGAKSGRLQGSIVEVAVLVGDPFFNAPGGVVEIDNLVVAAAADAHYTVAAAPAACRGMPPTRLAVAAHQLTPANLDAARSAGFNIVRSDFFWRNVEREGRYDFTAFDQRMAALEARGMQVIWILDYGHADHGGEYRPVSAEDKAAYVAYARAVAERYKGRRAVLAYEIWNEPNHFGWPKAPEEFAALARQAAEAIKEADPGATVVSGGLSWVDRAYLYRMASTGALAAFDAIGIHPYRQTMRPESFASDMRPIADILEANRVAAPVWATEWGQSAVISQAFGHPQGAAARERQAVLLLRQVLTQIGLGLPVATVYVLNDTGEDPKNAEHHYGLLDTQGRDKPSMQAMRVLEEARRGRIFCGPTHGVPPGLHVLRWDGPADTVQAVWLDGDEGTATLKLPRQAQVRRWDGTALPAGELRLTERDGVFFIHIPRAQAEDTPAR